MSTDKAPANLGFDMSLRCGDTSRRGVERMSFLKLIFTLLTGLLCVLPPYVFGNDILRMSVKETLQTIKWSDNKSSVEYKSPFGDVIGFN